MINIRNMTCSSIVLCAVVPVSCVSCSTNDNHFEMNIIAPSTNTFVASINDDGFGMAVIGSFTYRGVFLKNDMQLSHNFNKGLMSFSLEIVDLDEINKTFSVMLIISNGIVGEVSGAILFLSNAVEYKINYLAQVFYLNIEEEIE